MECRLGSPRTSCIGSKSLAAEELRSRTPYPRLQDEVNPEVLGLVFSLTEGLRLAERRPS